MTLLIVRGLMYTTTMLLYYYDVASVFKIILYARPLVGTVENPEN